jgi:hypothetical protein
MQAVEVGSAALKALTGWALALLVRSELVCDQVVCAVEVSAACFVVCK